MKVKTWHSLAPVAHNQPLVHATLSVLANVNINWVVWCSGNVLLRLAVGIMLMPLPPHAPEDSYLCSFNTVERSCLDCSCLAWIKATFSPSPPFSTLAFLRSSRPHTELPLTPTPHHHFLPIGLYWRSKEGTRGCCTPVNTHSWKASSKCLPMALEHIASHSVPTCTVCFTNHPCLVSCTKNTLYSITSLPGLGQRAVSQWTKGQRVCRKDQDDKIPKQSV